MIRKTTPQNGRPPESERPDRHRPDRGLHRGTSDHLTQAGRIGQVFSAGNAGGDLKGTPVVGYVRSGAMEDVVAGDPVNLGYLTVWAAHYLLTGHRFRPGEYQVGGPIGPAWYYARHQELRLGPPLTITKKNLAQYANKF
jgi:rhamnose transport system substrate-binding protein